MGLHKQPRRLLEQIRLFPTSERLPWLQVANTGEEASLFRGWLARTPWTSARVNGCGLWTAPLPWA